MGVTDTIWDKPGYITNTCAFSLGLDDDDQVDIDTYVDGDSQSLRESLQWEVASASPSPSDLVSTNNSKSTVFLSQPTCA